jgi:hypothetical protein
LKTLEEQIKAAIVVTPDAIGTDIALERFDSSLNSYQFQANNDSAALVPQKLQAKYAWDLQQLWEKFTDFKSKFKSLKRNLHRKRISELSP